MKSAVNPGWPHFDRYTFPPAVQSGNLLFVSGMTAADENGTIVSPGDIAGQTRYIYQKIEQVLRAAGGSLEDVVMTRDYITTTDGYCATADVRRELFGNDFPAATGVIVAGLLRRGALIEIEVVAVVDS